jgi:hypothetical protein
LFLALVTQHAMRMRRTILSSLVRLALQYLSTLSHKRRDSRENVTEYEICVSIFSTNLSQTFRSIRRIKRDTILVFWHRSFTFNSNKSPT